MKIPGAILTVLGAIAAIFGYNQMNSFEYKLASALGQSSSAGGAMITIAFYGGIALLIVGVIMLISSFLKDKKE